MHPTLRAALITGVLLVHGLAAAPLPHVVTADDLKNPVSQDEVRRWSERLTALGYAIAPEALGERVMQVSGAIGGTHRALLGPFRPMFRITGTGQGWALFANPDTHPSRLEISVLDSATGAWELRYRQLDPDHDWNAEVLSYRRVRGCHDAGGYRSKPRPVYRRFADWIGRRILAEEPPVGAVEVRTVRTHTTLPSERPDPREEIRHVITVERR